MADSEEWQFRARCPECSSVIWSCESDNDDGSVRPAGRVDCICSASWLEADGSFGGAAVSCNSGQMTAFIKKDHGRTVSLSKRRK